MKSFKLLLFILGGLGLMMPNMSYAQCPDDNAQFGASSVTCGAGLQTLQGGIWGGEFHAVNVVAGADYTFETCTGQTFNTQLTVYGAGGNLIAFNDDACGTASSVTFTAAATETVRVVVDEFDCLPGVNFISTVITGSCTSTAPPPANDDCANAEAINCGDTVAGTTFNATADGAPTCGTSNTAPGVWYSWTGDGSLATFSLCNGTATHDTKLSVYEGTCGALVCVDGNDDECGLQSEVSFTSTNGTNYLILVHGFGTETGPFDLILTCVAPPANDPACGAIAVTLGTPFNANSAGATAEAGEPNPGAGTGASSCQSNDGWCSFELDVDNSLWYTFVGPASGSVDVFVVNDNDGGSDTQFAIWEVGDCADFGTYTEVAANDDSGVVFLSELSSFSPDPPMMSVAVTPGTTYYLQVDGYDGDTYDVDINITIAPTVNQDDEDGDGNPDIIDPCSCADALNVKDAAGITTHFHDFVTIISAPGETWEISAINTGPMYTDNTITTMYNVGDALPEISPGVYHIDLWHADGVGFDADFDRTAGGAAITLNTGGTCDASICPTNETVPTLSEWGLIILALLLLNYGVLLLMNVQRARRSELA